MVLGCSDPSFRGFWIAFSVICDSQSALFVSLFELILASAPSVSLDPIAKLLNGPELWCFGRFGRLFFDEVPLDELNLFSLDILPKRSIVRNEEPSNFRLTHRVHFGNPFEDR